MARIQRQEFEDRFAGHRIRISQLSPQVLRRMASHGVTEADVRRIAGDDVISGAEVNALYEALAVRVRDGRRVDMRVSAELFAELAARAERVPIERTSSPAPAGSARVRTTGVGARPRATTPTDAAPTTPDATTTTPPAATPTPPGDAPTLPPSWDTRSRRVGRESIATHTRVEPSITQTAAAIAALPPSEERGHVPVEAYLAAVSARDERARLTGDGQRRAARRIGRPDGVPARIWNMSAALERRGISTTDAAHYIATGTLPDLYGDDGAVVQTGADRMAQLEQAATRDGSWTAVNSFTFLVSMRRSAMGAERRAAETHMATLPLGDARRSEIATAVAESRDLDEQLRRGLNSIYQSATGARERTGSSLVARADRLTQQAATARTEGDTARADRLEARAQSARDRGARIAHAEGQYRSAMPAYRSSAGRLFRVAAGAQIGTGEAEIRRTVGLGGALPETPPAALGMDDGGGTGNGVPGAQRLLGTARAVDPNAASDDTQLALEGRRSGALAVFHRAHLERGDYAARVAPGTATAPVRTEGLIAHRRAYLGARTDQAQAASSRIVLAENEPPSVDRDLRIAGLESERRSVADEFAGALGQSISSDRRLRDDDAQVTALVADFRAAGQGVRDAETASTEANDGRDRAIDADYAVFGDRLKTEGEAERDDNGVTDGRTIATIEEGRLFLARSRLTASRGALSSGRSSLRDSRVQATRDGQDAELVAAAMTDFPTVSGASMAPPASVREAHDRARALADHSAGRERRALDRAEVALPPGPTRLPTQTAIAARRLDLSAYYTRSAEAQVTALGDPGRAGATDRLDTAGRLIDQVDQVRVRLPAAGDERVALASGVVRARTELATANADYRPATSRDQLAAAERTTDTDLLPTRRDLAGAAYLQIGRSATVTLARSDQRFEAILDSHQYVAGAADDLYRQAHRMLDARRPTDRGSLIPDVPAARETRALLGRFDRAIATVDRMFAASDAQLALGRDYAFSRTRSLGQAEIQAAQAQVSTVISGGAFILSFGSFDMKEEMAQAGSDATGHRLHWIEDDTTRLQLGIGDMATSWTAASESGRSFEWLHAVRIFSDRSRRDTMPEAYSQAFFTINGGMSEDRARSSDWQHFNRIAIREGSVPIAAALRGPTLGFEGAMGTLGDSRIMAITPTMMDGIDSQSRSLAATTDGMMWVIGLNTSLEVALGVVLTGGIGSGAAVAEGANAVNAVRTGAQAINAARTATLAMRALHVARTVGTVTVVGGGMMAANYGVGRLAGRNTGFARGFETLTNFIPIGAGQRVAGLGRAAAGADDVAAATTRMGRLRQAMSWSQVRELSAWGRALTPAVLGGTQAFATTMATPFIAQRVGLERSELGQAAIGLALNAVFAGGMAAAIGPARPARAMADHLTRAASADGRVSRRVRSRVQAEIETFTRQTEGRVPTEAEVTGLRTRLYERLGLSEASPDVGERRAMVDGAIEAIRIDRATTLSLAEADGNPTRALELAGERLFEARGGESGGASRLQSYRDSAMLISERLGADAQRAFQSGDAARGDQLMRQRSEVGDRATSAEIVDGVMRASPEGGSIRTPADRQRVEGILAGELSTARQSIDSSDGPGLTTADYDRVAQRLVDEGHVSPAEAATIVEGARRELVQQGVVRHLSAAQANAGGRPLTNAEITTAAADLARRAGLPDPTGFAQTVLHQRAALERTGVVRPLSHGPSASTAPDPATITRQAAEAAAAEPEISRFIQSNGAGAEQLVGMVGREAFMRAFTEDGHVPFDARRLLDLPPERMAELATLARDNPQRVQALLHGMSGESGHTVLRAAREVGVERAAALAQIATESPRGFGYLRSLEGGEARIMEALRSDPAALRAGARSMEQRVFMRASDGTYLLRGDVPEPVPTPSQTQMEGLARRAGVDPAVLADPTAHPAEMSRVIQQMRSELAPDARRALDRELQGRRFIDEAHYEEARNAGVDNPEHRYGRVDFEGWQRAESIMRGAAERGEPLTVDTLIAAHRAASEGLLPEARRGHIRSAGTDTVFQGGDGPMGIQEVTAAQFDAMRTNPHLVVHDLGATSQGGRRIAVEYTRPQEVRGALETALGRIDRRLAAGEDPVVVAADAQREVVSIHPFMDGNGRMSRLVMDYVFQRAGIEPSVVRDPNLDTAVSRGAWQSEVRRGLVRPFEATQRAWSRARRGMPPPDAPPRTATPPTTDLYTRRDTIGWTGEPTRSPPPGAEHLGVIHRGMSAMPERTRQRIDMLLARAEDAAPHLVAERESLGTRQAQLHREHGALLAMPIDRLSGADLTRRQSVDAELGQIQTRMVDVDRGIRTSRREARALAVQEMDRYRRSLIHGTDETARARADALSISPEAARRAGTTELRGWATELFRLVGRDIQPERIRLTHTEARANAHRSGALNVGDNPTQGLVFHELGHFLEYANPEVARAARAWVLARSRLAGGGEAQTRSMRDLTGSDFYRPDERAFEDHFENPYVGRDYGADPSTEVVSVGLEYLTSADRMLHLYQRDPEHFFFVMGVLQP